MYAKLKMRLASCPSARHNLRLVLEHLNNFPPLAATYGGGRGEQTINTLDVSYNNANNSLGGQTQTSRTALRHNVERTKHDWAATNDVMAVILLNYN